MNEENKNVFKCKKCGKEPDLFYNKFYTADLCVACKETQDRYKECERRAAFIKKKLRLM